MRRGALARIHSGKSGCASAHDALSTSQTAQGPQSSWLPQLVGGGTREPRQVLLGRIGRDWHSNRASGHVSGISSRTLPVIVQFRTVIFSGLSAPAEPIRTPPLSVAQLPSVSHLHSIVEP